MESKACCDSEAGRGVAEPDGSVAVGSVNYRRYLLPGTLLLSGWWLLYRSLAPFSMWMTYDVFSLNRGAGFASAVEFFIFDTPKVLLLLTLVVFGVGIARSYFTPDRARRILAGKREAAGVETTEEAAKSLGLEYRMEKVTDIQAIMGFGVMMTPALAVDGVVKVSGRVPSAEEMRKILSD